MWISFFVDMKGHCSKSEIEMHHVSLEFEQHPTFGTFAFVRWKTM